MTLLRPRDLRARFRYAVDNALTKGLWLLLPWMAGGLLAAVSAVGLLIWLWEAGPGDQRVPLIEAIWIALTRSLDPGTFGQDEGPHFRIAGLVITVIGLLAIAPLIGLIANAVDRRLEELRQGRSIGDPKALRGGLRLNPPKHEVVTLSPSDHVVLLCAATA